MSAVVATCERCECALELGDLRCVICGQAAPRKGERRAAIEVQVLRCEGCGAAVSYDPKVQAPKCGYCGSVMRIESIEDPMEQTESFLPFTAGAASARLALRRWLGELGRFRPSDLKSSARLESLRPLWWVAWGFDATAEISWTADSDHGNRRSDWAPHAGQTEMKFDDIVVPASRGLSEEEADALAPYYDLTTARPQPEGAEDGVVEQFDVQRSLARRRVLAGVDETAIERVTRGHIPGSRFRNVHVTALLRSLVTRRYALPVYVLAYRYKEKLYRVLVHGQDAGCVYGKAPYSIAKITAAVATAVAVALAIAWLVTTMA
jgi:hypothetical protein